MPPPRRIPAARRPRVAGRHHAEPAHDPSDTRGTTRPTAPDSAPDTAPDAAPDTAADVDGTGPDADDTGRTRAGVATLVALIAVTLIGLGLAAWFRGEANQLSGSASASNQALVDVGTTAQVAGQMRDAVERVYSYDFARLDDNEKASRQVITGQFAQDFTEQFGRVRELAPGQQAVVVAKVLNVGVKALDGDRAIVVVFLDQQADRGVEAKQLLVAGRLTVTAQRVDGQWKIAGVEPF